MTTSFLGLSTFDDSSASSTTFSTFRNAIAGNNSNFTILDIFSSATSASITSLKTNTFTAISANQISTNYYEASAANLTGYLTNMPINLKLNTNISGSSSLNINGYGVKNLMKIDTSGCAIALVTGDITINKYNPFIYNGSYWILVGQTNGSVVSVNISGSGVMSTSTGSIVNHNTSGVTSGSYNKIIVDIYGHVTAGSVVSVNDATVSGSNIWTGTNEFNSSVGFNCTTVTGNTTLNNTHANVNADATSGSITIILPTASGIKREYTIKKIDSTANTVVIDASGSQTIDNSLTKTLSSQYSSATIYADSDNLKWWIK